MEKGQHENGGVRERKGRQGQEKARKGSERKRVEEQRGEEKSSQHILRERWRETCWFVLMQLSVCQWALCRL
jgi:hypothetical protein